MGDSAFDLATLVSQWGAKMSGKVRLGIIGTSGWTELMYLNNLRNRADVEISALCGRSWERLAEMAAKHGAATTYTDYRRMIDEVELDAVIVVAPDDLHREMTLAAIEKGLHVLCEKPLANNADDARLMQEAAEKAGVKHMVLFTWRWQPHFQYLKSMVEENLFGAVYRAQFSFLAGFARDGTYQWRHDPKRANGVLGDLGSHMIDMSRWLFGEIATVTATLGTSISRAGVEGHAGGSANDSAHLSLQFESGLLAVVDTSVVAHSADMLVKQIVRIEGEKATLELEHIFLGASAGVTIRLMRADSDVIERLTVPPHFFGSSNPADFLDIYNTERVGPLEFIAAVREGRQPQPGFEVGAKVQAVVDSAVRSHAEGRRVAVGSS
jgi:predicted dehydrogenase